MYLNSSRGNRDTSTGSLHGNRADTTGKVNSRKPVVNPGEESDGNIVPGKSANNGMAIPAESMEGRTPTKRNSGQKAANRMQSREFASNGLVRVRQTTPSTQGKSRMR